jgi:PKD repeat protein
VPEENKNINQENNSSPDHPEQTDSARAEQPAQPAPSGQQPEEVKPEKKEEYLIQQGLPEEILQKVDKRDEGKQPAASNQQPAASGQQPGKDDKKKIKKPKKIPVIGCLIGFVFLYIFSVGLGIFILWLNKDSPEFLQNFGFISDTELQKFILMAVNWAFFPLALIFLVLTVVGIFMLSTAKKDQPEKRKRGVSMALINSVALFVVIPIWIAVWVFVNNLPVSDEIIKAEIVMTPEDTTALVAPTVINFNAENIVTILQRKGLIVESLAWDFDGDKNYESQADGLSINHEFKTSQTVQVSLQVLLDDGSEQLYDKIVNIPRGTFDADVDEGPSPLTVSFDAAYLTSGLNIANYRWDFDNDGEYDEESSAPSVKHTFRNLGTQTIVLQTVDRNNNVKEYTKDIKIIKGVEVEYRAVIDATPGYEGTTPYKVQFDGGDSVIADGKSINKYEWNFGDGSPIKTGEKVNYIFRRADTYPVELTITDEDGEKTSVIQEIIVKAPEAAPEAVMKTDPPFNPQNNQLIGTIPFEVQFDASRSVDADDNITEYTWDFDGDEEINTYGSTETYIYREPGTYQVTLTVTDADGQSSEFVINVEVEEFDTAAVIVAKPESGPAPLTVEFDASQSITKDESEIVSFEWDFGDGVVLPTGAVTTHRYNEVGNYRVRLKISSATGEIAEAEKMIFVRVVPLQSCFEPSRTTGKAPLSVRFNPSCSTGTIKKWFWKFGDGFTNDKRVPTHTFKESGNYTVVLEITDEKNTVSTYSQLINVQ